MDKSKSKDNLRAAGKKRLEEFRQKKQQKGNSGKSSGTALKALAAEDRSLSDVSGDADSSRTEHDNELQQEPEEQGPNLTGQASSLSGMPELGVETPKGAQSSEHKSTLPADRESDSPLSNKKESVESEPFEGSEATDPAESSSQSEVVTGSMSLDQGYAKEAESSERKLLESSQSHTSMVGGSPKIRQVEHSNFENAAASRLDNSASSSSDIQEQILHYDRGGLSTSLETSEQAVVTEVEVLKRQLQILVEEKEQVSKRLVVKAEQQLQETSEVQSLLTEKESIQKELHFTQIEKAQLVEEFASSLKDLQNTNQHLASELMASQQQVLVAQHGSSLLSGDLELAKQERNEVIASSAVELERMQQLLLDGEVRRVELMTELATSTQLSRGLQEEKALLVDELEHFREDVRNVDEQKLLVVSEIEASKRCVQTLEEDLASERRALQEMEELVGQKSELVEASRASTEKLEASVLAKELELKACRDHMCNMKAENLGLVREVEEFQKHLQHARQKDEDLQAVLEAQQEASQEQLRRTSDEKLELSGELEKLKLLSERLSEERSNLLAKFGMDLEQLRQDLKKKGEEYVKQGNQLLESRQEVQDLSDEHAQAVKKMELSLDECRTTIDRLSDEKSKVVQELKLAKEQLVALTEEKGQEVTSLGYELRECKDLVRMKFEENSSLVTLLEESSGKLQKTAQCASELAAELEKYRAVSDGLLEEKGTLAAEVLEIRAQWQLMQTTATERELELEQGREHLRDLEEDHSKLSNQLAITSDELSQVRANKTALELELVENRKQMTKLEEQNAVLVNLLEDSMNDLQQLREDNLQSSADLASELDKHRALSSGLLEEKDRVASELQEVVERWQLLQQDLAQSGREHSCEIQERGKQFKELEDKHTELSNKLTVSQNEISALKEAKSIAELEVARYKEDLAKMEDVNKDLAGRLDVLIDEKAELLGHHVSELDRFKEHKSNGEETNVKLTAHLQELLSELQELKSEKTRMGLELETYKEQYQEMGDKLWTTTSKFNKCKDQLQRTIEEKALRESMLGSELQESREQATELEEGNALLLTELESLRERLQNMHEQKVNERGKLLQQVQALVQSQEQTARELAEAQEHALVLEAAHLELQSNLEASSHQLKICLKEKDVLLSDLEVSKDQLHELVKENGDVSLEFEAAVDSWQAEKVQLSEGLEVSLRNQQVHSADKAKIDSELAELTLKAHETDNQRAKLAMEIGALKESMESSEEQRAHFAVQVEGKGWQVQTLEFEKSQLDTRLREEREKVTSLNDQVTGLTEALHTTTLRIEELESERAQSKVDYGFSQTQMDLLAEEKKKLAEELQQHVLKGEESLLGIESKQSSLQIHEDTSVEELLGLRRRIEAKEGELDQLKAQNKLLQIELEASNVERCDLVQDLVTLRRQLQQISQEKSHVADELAIGVEASRQRMLEIGETKNESILKVDNAFQDVCVPVAKIDEKQDIGGNTEDVAKLTVGANASVPEASALQLESAGQVLEANPSSRSDDAGVHLASCVQNLVQEFERKAHHSVQGSGAEQHSHGFSMHITELFSQLKMLRETSENLEQELYAARSVEGTLRLELQTEAEQIRKAFEENLLLTALVEQLEGEQHQVDMAVVQVAELHGQVAELAEKVANLQLEKDTAMNAQVAAQAELRQSKENLEEENVLLAGRLRVLEGTATMLQMERDDLAGKFIGLEQSHSHLSEKVLQDAEDKVTLRDQVDAFEVQLAEKNTELGNLKDDVSQSERHLQSLVQKLEDVIGDAFPEAGQDVLSSKHTKSSADYCNSLATIVHTEVAEVCHQLQNMHMQCSETSKIHCQTDEQLIIMQRERDVAVETSDQMHSQWKKATDEKKELQTSFKELEAIASVEKQDLVSQIDELVQNHGVQLAQGASELASVHAIVSDLQKRIADQEAVMAVEAAAASKLDGELQSIVSKLLSGTLIAPGEPTKDLIQLDPGPISQLEAGIATLLKRCEDSALQIENLKQKILLSVESEQSLQNHAAENAQLRQVLLSMQDTSQSREVELDVLHERVEEQALIVARQANDIEGLLLQIQSLGEQLDNANADKASLQSGLTQAEQKLSLTREKLSLAVNKGKAVVQQRDAWKMSLVEKSKELDLLVVAHQEDLQMKDAALKNAEMRIVEQKTAAEQMVQLETQLGSLRRLISTAEQVFLENDDLVQGLCAVLDSPVIPDNWPSCELPSKIEWIISCANKLLQELVARKAEVQSLMENSSKLESTAERSERRATTLAAELRSMELEKEEVVSRLEDHNNQLQLELHQMVEEKAQLTDIIRQLDVDVAKQNHDKEDIVKRLQEKATDIVNFESEIDSLQRKVSQQEEELNKGVSSYHSLNATVHTIFRNLTNLYETISPSKLDAKAADSSLHLCKYFMESLISNHNVIAVKLKEILHQVYLSRHASGEALDDDVFPSWEGKDLSRELSSDLFKTIEEAFVDIEQQVISLQTLCDRLTGDIAGEQNEKTGLQLELTKKAERFANDQEKLSAAVSMGESLVHQRDSLKQDLVEKSAQLERLATACKEELQSKDEMVQETNQRLTSSLEQVSVLEKELLLLKDSVASSPDPSIMARLSDMGKQLSEAQLKGSLAESEAENARNAAALLSSELEASQTRLDNLERELGTLSNDKEELVQQLERSSVQQRVELQQVVAERTQLLSKISTLEQDLAMQKQREEIVLQDYDMVFQSYSQLTSQAAEAAAERSTLHREAENLHQIIAQLEISLKTESAARTRLESDTEAAVARIQHCTGEPLEEEPFQSMTSIPSHLEALSALLVVKYEVAMQDIQDLSKQTAKLAESQQTMLERALSKDKDLEQVQQRLASRDLELSEVSKRMEDADSRRSEQEGAAQGFLKEVHMLRQELEKARCERDALQSDLVQAEQKAGTTREKLGMAIKKGKGLAQQRDSLKQALSEQQLLVSNSKEELQNKESALEKAAHNVSKCEEEVQALKHNVSSLRNFVATLEQRLQVKDNLTKKMEGVLTKCDFPIEWQSRQFTEKLEWLVAAVANAKHDLIVAGQEAAALRETSVQLTSELTDTQRRAEEDQEAQSILGLKLEEIEGELKWSQDRIAQLEADLLDLGGATEQTELLSRKVLNLEASLQQKHTEVSRAEESLFAWAERAKDSDRYIRLSQERISELEQKVEELAGAQQQVALLHDKIAKLEEAVQQKEAAVKAMEASRGKAVNKLNTTVNKFRELCQQSEGLVVELERMHGNVEDKDAEIAQLKGEVVKIISKSQILQEELESKRSFLVQLEKLLETATLSGNNTESSLPLAEQKEINQIAVRKPDEERCLANVSLLQNRLSGLTVQSQGWQVDLQRKDVQLQGLRKELEEVIVEQTHLKANLQREQFQSERLKAEVASMHAPLTERGANQTEEIEVQVGKRLLPISSPSPHVRGPRKPASTDVAIDMDVETSQLLSEFDDKGHGFRSLTNSHFMPRGSRAISDQIDRLCVAGGRVLMRQPAARLGVILYLLAIHIWMVFLISAAHM